ncbi:RNA polymerase sigma factor RpoE [Methylovulum psychrotolerans]|uniref:RNA polymerase sigma factor n=1 Tax=Methylovulum psychrotolerans TaxID=1704499 RepID=A0A1Z4BZK0_9GAMM|nr:RNA polymerase sigma factor RpoE [Methylovulum psychrotolerans]ASF46692.1 RNA polymerase sigma factor RpoE [Methylovulum psychrotolerans]MBT9099049.1 RNA polymerase sigma factor RpoE [Methylovulum psychrotolerans]POZ50926.1 RNA polymerase sigma factor RpoE [Methylovulum psychrotolerans]
MNSQNRTSEHLDEELVARVQQGDKKAYDLLVIKYQHKIVQLVNRYLKDPSEAQDVAQEAFIKAYRAIGSFRGESTFYTWLYRIAINTAKNYLVSRSRRSSQYEVDIQDAEAIENAPQLQGIDTPERLLLNEEIIKTIRAAIDHLPEEMRTAIMLREFEGMSYEEIAEAMECPVGTVRSRIFRAREAIDSKLNPLLTHGDF